MRRGLLLIALVLLVACNAKMDPVVPVDEIMNTPSLPEVQPQPTIIEPEQKEVLPQPKIVYKTPEPEAPKLVNLEEITVYPENGSSLIHAVYKEGSENLSYASDDPTTLLAYLQSEFDLSAELAVNITTFVVKEVPKPVQEEEPTTEVEEIVIRSNLFSPEEHAIKRDTKVVWTNLDGEMHTVTSLSGPTKFRSGTLGPNRQFSYTFTEAGTYEYHSELYPTMHGKIIVE